MMVGSEFHEFAGEFFKGLNYAKLLTLESMKEVKDYFVAQISPDVSKLAKPLCENFVNFEAEQWLRLREEYDDPLWFFIPVATEIRLQAYKPGLRLSGHIDRIDRMPNSAFAIVEYKTGRPRIRDLRRELHYYVMLARENYFPVDWVAMYNPKTNDVVLEKVSKRTLKVVERRLSQIRFAHHIDEFPRRINTFCHTCPVFEGDCVNSKEVQEFGGED